MEKIQKWNQTWPVRQEVRPYWACSWKQFKDGIIAGAGEGCFITLLEFEFKNDISLQTAETTTKDSITASLVYLEYRQKQENRQKKCSAFSKLVLVTRTELKFHYL